MRNKNNEVTRLRQRLAAIEEEAENSRASVQRELALAAKIQQTLLPNPIRHERILADVRYLPIEALGGDYCQLRFSDPNILYVTMTDITGHGIGPALLATRVSSEVRHCIQDQHSPKEFVRILNQFIREYFAHTGLFLSFFVARIDLQKKEIRWSGAGHPSPLLLYQNNKEVELLTSQNVLIGVVDDPLCETPEHSLSISVGDRLVFCSDGLLEVRNSSGAQLGTMGLKLIIQASPCTDLFKWADLIIASVNDYRDNEISDDITLIVMELI